jgi:hypothetical protein
MNSLVVMLAIFICLQIVNKVPNTGILVIKCGDEIVNTDLALMYNHTDNTVWNIALISRAHIKRCI